MGQSQGRYQKPKVFTHKGIQCNAPNSRAKLETTAHQSQIKDDVVSYPMMSCSN